MKINNTSISYQDFHWLIGLLEGEGWFIGKTGKRLNEIKVGIGMTDLDVIQRVSKLFGNRKIYKSAKGRNKPMYEVYLIGEQAFNLMMILKSFMGIRRRKKIEKLINGWKYLKPRISDRQVLKLRNLYKSGKFTIIRLARKFNMPLSTIYNIVSGRSRKYVTS